MRLRTAREWRWPSFGRNRQASWRRSFARARSPLGGDRERARPSGQGQSAINAVVMEMPDEALVAARQIDERLARGEDAGPLAGVPITIKVTSTSPATSPGRLKPQRDLADVDVRRRQPAQGAAPSSIGAPNVVLLAARPPGTLDGRARTLGAARPRRAEPRGASRPSPRGSVRTAHGTTSRPRSRYPAYAAASTACGRRSGAADPFTGKATTSAASDGGVGSARAHHRRRAAGFHAMAAGDGRDPWWTPVPLISGPRPGARR